MGGINLERDPDRGLIWSHIRGKWLPETPQEAVRQRFVLALVNSYGYSLGQLGERDPCEGLCDRFGVDVWLTEQTAYKSSPIIVVECSGSDSPIHLADYSRGEAYARSEDAVYFVTCNARETKCWGVSHDAPPGGFPEIKDIPHVGATLEEMMALEAAPRPDAPA